MECDVSVCNNIYGYCDINKIFLNRINFLSKYEITISDVYVKDNIACKIFCCLVFSAKLIAFYPFVKTGNVLLVLLCSSWENFKNIRESKLNLFKGIGKLLLCVIVQCVVLTLCYVIGYFCMNPYFWMIFFGILAAAILIMTVIGTICLCRSDPVFLYAYEYRQETDEGIKIEHTFAEKTIDRYDLTPLQGDKISFREKIFIRKKEIIRVSEDEPEM